MRLSGVVCHGVDTGKKINQLSASTMRLLRQVRKEQTDTLVFVAFGTSRLTSKLDETFPLSLSHRLGSKRSLSAPGGKSPRLVQPVDTHSEILKESMHLPLGQRQGAGLMPVIPPWLSQAAHLRQKQVGPPNSQLHRGAPPAPRVSTGNDIPSRSHTRTELIAQIELLEK